MTPCSPPRILIVDDDETALLVARVMFQKLGYQVEAVSSGQAALDCLGREPEGYQGILLDFSMPEMNGAEALTRLRQVAPEVKVLVTSGFTEEEVRAQLGPGAIISGFLPKPFDLDLLRVRLEGVF